MHRIRAAVVLGIAALLLAACTLPGRHDVPAADAADSTPDGPDPSGDRSPADEPVASDERPREQPDYAALALRPENYVDAMQRRMAALVGSQHESLPSSEAGYYMDLQEANLRQALHGTGLRIARRDNRIVLTLAGEAGFDTADTRIPPGARAALADMTRVLTQYPETFLAVHGHTDPVGDADYNRRLSEQRALQIARRFIEDGVPLDRVVVIGHGESRPAPTDTSPGSRQPDRRIEIHLQPIVRPQ